jgi:hypothetical protein
MKAEIVNLREYRDKRFAQDLARLIHYILAMKGVKR